MCEFGDQVSNFTLDISQLTKHCSEDIRITAQSIGHWEKYCQYHYLMLVKSTSPDNLYDDKLFQEVNDENVSLRVVYEAHIVGFMNCLHSLLDSFPHLLNLMFHTQDNDHYVGWNKAFLKKYYGQPFEDLLKAFFNDDTFKKVKLYVNTIKHKHLIRIANYGTHLEFESCKETELIKANVMLFIKDCFNYLIPRFFSLCKAVFKGFEQQPGLNINDKIKENSEVR